MATRVSTLNPNAPLFVPAAMAMAMAPQHQHQQHQQQRRVVEEFSSEWWSLVQTCPEFREQWMRDRLPAVEQQQMFQADLEELADLDAFLQYQQEMEAATTHDEPSWNFDDVGFLEFDMSFSSTDQIQQQVQAPWCNPHEQLIC